MRTRWNKVVGLVSAAALSVSCTAVQSARRSDSNPRPSHPSPAAGPEARPLAQAPVPARAPSQPAPSGASEREQFEKGVAAYEAGKLDEAEAAFGSVLKHSPGDVSAQYNLGLIAERKGDWDKAQKAYQSAHTLDARNVPSIVKLGEMYWRRDRASDAAALYEETLKSGPKSHELALLNHLAGAYRAAKDFPKAEATARQVLTRSPDSAEAYKNLALIYYDQGKYSLAEFVGLQARKLDERDPAVHNTLGMIYLKMNDQGRALASFQRAVAADGHFAAAHANVGALALAYRDYVAAEQAFHRAMEVDPALEEAKRGYAFALDGQRVRDPKKGVAAGAAFEQALTVRPSDRELTCAAGWAYSADRAGWDKARGLLERCKSGSSDSVEQQRIEAKLQAMRSVSPPHDVQGTNGEPAAASAGQGQTEQKAQQGLGGSPVTPGVQPSSEGAAVRPGI